MITQNKGEWSELYVFFKLLGDGVLYAADGNLDKKEDLYYPVVEILRKENNQNNHYIKNDVIINIVDELGNQIISLPAKEFELKAGILLKAIQKSDSTFSIPVIENFMQHIKCTKVKADSTDKSDITLVLHDCKTYRNDTLGFSIKSKLGGSSTLLNAGKSTNFIFEILGNLSDSQIQQINAINTKSKIRDRLAKITTFGCRLNFCKLDNEIFNANLQMIDSFFPRIVSEFLLQYYSGKGNLICELTPIVRTINPCNFNITLQHNYYKYKMKNFLTDVALGMTPATVWNGNFQATGDILL